MRCAETRRSPRPMTRAAEDPHGPRERPSWLPPLVLFGITAALGAGILAILLWPRVAELVWPSSTESVKLVRVDLSGAALDVPQNLIARPSARGGGRTEELALLGLLPDMAGFSAEEAEAFSDHSGGSRLVRVTLRRPAEPKTERERFEAIYARQLDPSVPAMPAGDLKLVAFAPDGGYRDRRLYLRDEGDDFAAIVCARAGATGAGDACARTVLVGGIEATYEFRDGRLKDWRTIDAAVKGLVERLTAD